MTPEREAELRRIAANEDWMPARIGDLKELFGEIDRLRERLEDVEGELEFVAARAHEH